MIVVTGATGFIGSNLLVKMEYRGYDDIIAIDTFGNCGKWKNVEKLSTVRFNSPVELDDILKSHKKEIEAIIHMGGVSSTTETDADLVVKNNIELTIKLYFFCKSVGIPFIYASSASTYGNGENGYYDNDDLDYLKRLRPQNLYGWSKCYIDRFITYDKMKSNIQNQVVGLKFFNVYGPNESHKKDQASVMYKFYHELQETQKIRLFKSYNELFRDGEQKRDFVYVDDCVDVILWALGQPSVNGIYNVGTGYARTFLDVANIIKSLCSNEADIEYTEMPLEIQKHYQYYTCADIKKLREAGYDKPFYSIEEGISRYINDYLKSK